MICHTMKFRLLLLTLFFLLLCQLVPVNTLVASPLDEMQLLPGYKHVPLQGIDSVVGKIEKRGWLDHSL